MRDDQTRVTVAQWEKLKTIIPPESTEMKLTPKFGYVVDKFREMYGIYISTIPVSDDDIIIYRFRSQVYKISGNNVIDTWTGTNQAFYIGMRYAINQAIEMVNKQ